MREQPLRKMDTLLSLLTIRFELITIGGIIYVGIKIADVILLKRTLDDKP